MNVQLFTDYPSWFWLLCFLAGGIYAFAMYYREKKMAEAISNKWWLRGLAVLRFTGVVILAFLLLNPYLKSKTNETEKPVVVIMQDNSSSIQSAVGDSVGYREKLNSLYESLSETYDVRTYSFGSSMQEGFDSLNFKEKSTDISSALSDLNNLYENLNVGAVILASDGIYNTGSNPVYVKNNLGAPFYTIALGDTTPKKDLRITRVLHNNIVYLNDKFVVTADIEAIFCNGKSSKGKIIEVLSGSTKTIGEQVFEIKDNNFNTSLTWEVDANTPGIRHFQVSLTSIEGEYTTVNNMQDIFIEVLDARQKVLLLANAPHPDLNAIRQSIESNRNYEIDLQLANELKGNVNDYDIIILHQLPSSKNDITQVLADIKNKQIPTWFFAGSQTATGAFNKAQPLVSISSGGQSANEITGIYQNNFNLFNLEPSTISLFSKLPAINAPYGQYTVSPASQVLLNQKIGAVNTKNPLLVYNLTGSSKMAVFCAENFWKWRLYDYVMNNNQVATNELVSKTLQYLSTKNDKKQFRVNQTRTVINENEPVILDAELYNDSYELINEPDATLTIKNESGKDFPFQFSKNNKSYVLRAGFFPAGNYTYEGKVVYNGKEFKDNGAFSVSPLRLETINTTADHQLLNQLAVQNGGQMVYPDNMQTLTSLINESAAAKPVMREIVRTQSIINLKWICFVLLALLGIEWFVRKFNGGY